MPTSRPRVEFNETGICNACLHAANKSEVDWDARKQEFIELVAEHRPDKGPYDCLVPWSGGKDSSTIAHRLKFEFGLNPLLVTFSPLIPNEIGTYNREQMLKLGFDHLMERPKQNVSRRLARRFFVERGNPKVHWDAGINSFPVQVAVRFKIPLIIYAEHGESEYGGRVLNEDAAKYRNFTEVIEHQIGDDPLNWTDDQISDSDLAPYIYPDLERVEEVGVIALYFGHFFRWSMYENYQYIRNKFDFRTAAGGRTDGTFTDFDSLDDKIDNLYYYMQFIKFGFGRATRDASRMIQNGHMMRSEGLRHVKDTDGEYPTASHVEHLDYLDLNETELTETIDLHRNREIWKFDGNDWSLRFPPR